MKNELSELLERMPWANKNMLIRYFKREKFERLLAECSDDIVVIELPGGKIYFSEKPADYHLVPGIYRRDMVRQYMVDEYGYSILETAESPCYNADFRVFVESNNFWFRVWGDMGHISAESLVIFKNPPEFASDVYDLVITCQGMERVSFLKVQAELNWTKAQNGNVEIVDYLTRKNIKDFNFPDKQNQNAYDPNSDEYPKIDSMLVTYNDTRKRPVTIQKLRSAEICLKSLNLSPEDYDLLRFIACNPFLNQFETGLLFGGGDASRDSKKKMKEERDRMKAISLRVPELAKNGLLERMADGPMEGTYILSWQAIDLIAAYHATIPFYLKKYSQLPQESFEKADFDKFRNLMDSDFPYFDSHCYYKKRWGVHRPEHQKLCKEVCAALLCGAQTLKSRPEINVNPKVTGLTTVSSNLKISAMSHGKKTFKQLHPDGACTLEINYGSYSGKFKLFLEIERNTNRKDALEKKLDNYRKFIPSAKQFYKGYDDILLMFFYDDTTENPWTANEKRKYLLETMTKYGIRGCVGFLSNAKNIPYCWEYKSMNIGMKTCGNMVLYQRMWQTTDTWPDQTMQSFPTFLIPGNIYYRSRK